MSTYAKTFDLPLKLNTKVQRLHLANQEYIISTNNGEFTAANVIIATGAFQNPFIPRMNGSLSDQIYQCHSSHYKNPKQLKEGPVLVVGGGNSGAQIAVELSKERETYLSVSHKIKFLPQDILHRSIFLWLDKLGIYSANVNSMIGQFIKKQPDPIFGNELKIQIRTGKIIIKPRTISISNDSIIFKDDTRIKVNNVIWSTGYKSDYRWIDIDGVLNDKGFPIHQRGISPIKGIYFIGLPWQYSRGSALIQGVGKDAEYLIKHIQNNAKVTIK